MRYPAILRDPEPPLRTSIIRSDRNVEALKGIELSMILVSLGLLLLTCIEISVIREPLVIAWLVSLVLVGLRNTGAGLGLYVAAVALYSNHHSGGQFSVFDRPDHAALLVLFVQMGLLRMRNKRWFSIDWLILAMCAFLVYGLVNGVLTGTFAAWKVGQFARAFGIPFLLAILALKARPTTRDIQSFFLVVLIVAGHSAAVSMLWVTEFRDLIFPAWINDPGVNPLAGLSRAGGILMHPGHNGKLLSLAFCILVLVYRHWITGYGRLLLMVLGAALLIGIFLSYSRAAYLGMIAGVLILFWQKRSGERSTAIKRSLLIGTAVIGLAISLVAPPEMLETRVTNEQNVIWRFEIWKIALRMVPQRPLFGYGFNGYGENAAAFHQHSDVLTQQNLESGQPAVHNTFLNLMIEFGLVGFLLYAGILYLLFRRAAVCSQGLWGREGVIWVLVFLIVYLIPSQFSVVQNPAVNLVFYCCPALLGGLVRRSSITGHTWKGERPLAHAERFQVRASS